MYWPFEMTEVGLRVFISGGNQLDIHSCGGLFSLKFLNKLWQAGLDINHSFLRGGGGGGGCSNAPPCVLMTG